MYTPITVKPRMGGAVQEGHAYDLSESGLQFELDSALRPGTPVLIEVTLPAREWPESDTAAKDRTIAAIGNIVWADESEPGPVRMAMTVTRFASEADRERLMDQLSSGRLARAA